MPIPPNMTDEELAAELERRRAAISQNLTAGGPAVQPPGRVPDQPVPTARFAPVAKPPVASFPQAPQVPPVNPGMPGKPPMPLQQSPADVAQIRAAQDRTMAPVASLDTQQIMSRLDELEKQLNKPKSVQMDESRKRR